MLSWYVTSHSGQLSVLPSAGREMCTAQGAIAMLCCWEVNGRFGVIVAICHKLRDLSTYWFSGLKKVDEHPSILL